MYPSRPRVRCAALVVAAACVVLLAAPDAARAQCAVCPSPGSGGTSTTLGARADAGLPTGITEVSLSFAFGRFDTEYEADKRVDSLDTPVLTRISGVLRARRHLGSGWAVGLAVPTASLHLDPEAVGVAPGRAAGYGDLTLDLGYDLAALWGAGPRAPHVALGLGLGLPTGAPGSLHTLDEGLGPEATALGLGAFAATVSIDATWFPLDRLGLSLPIRVKRPLHRSPENISFGQSTSAGLGLLLAPLPWLSANVHVLYRRVGQAHIGGVGMLEDSGRTSLDAEAALGLALTPRVQLGLLGRYPLYYVVHGRQIAETFSVGARLALTLGAEEDRP